MKGLIFNLLHEMAQQSGCADEAWDLVMEFVASETDSSCDDTCLSAACSDDTDWLALESPGETMVQCLATDPAGLAESLSEFPELPGTLEAEGRLSDTAPALLEPDFISPSTAPGGVFSHDLLSLLEQLLAEALAGGEPEDLDEEELRGSGWDPTRGSES